MRKTIKSEYYTVKHWGYLHQVSLDYPARLEKGLECYKESLARGYEIVESRNANGHKVNKYHKDILRICFMGAYRPKSL